MDYRLLIVKLAGLLLPPILAKLKQEAEKTPSPIDDSLIQVGEVILGLITSGAINDIIKKPQ